MPASNRKTANRTKTTRKDQRPDGTHRARRRLFMEGLEQRQMMAIDVAVIGGSGDTSGFAAIVNQLNDDTYFDFNATLLTEAQADTVGELNAYDVVVVGNSGSGGIDYSQFESALRSFVEAGGGVVSTGWIVDWANEVTHADLAAVVPIDLGNYRYTAPGTITITNGMHPITSGVTDFAASYVEGSVVGADAGSTLLAETNYTSPVAFVAPSVIAADIVSGRSVYLGPIYSGSTGYGNSDLRSGMADRLFEQSLAWAAKITGVPNQSLSAALVGGNLVITDSTGVNNSLSISNNGAGAIVITDAAEAFVSTGGIAGATLTNSGKTLTVPVASIAGAQVIINGMEGDDTLTANLTNALGKIVTFNGGDPIVAPGDTLVVTGGVFATGTLNHTNATDGSVVFGANTINYTGLEPVDVTGSTITDLVINLPDNNATPDDTELSISGGNLLVTSLNGTHESDSIALAAFTTVTVNTRMGDDTLRLDATMATFNKVLTLNGNLGADNFVFETSITAPGTITVNGGAGTDRLDYSAYKVAAVDTSVDVNLTATAANGFSGNVKVGANTIASFTDIDRVTGNSTATSDSLTGLNAVSTWTVEESGTNKYVSTGTLEFSKIEKLNGGTAADKFEVIDPAAVAFTLSGAGGTDTLDVSGAGATTVTITNDNATAGFDGTFGASNFTSVDSFLGAAGSTFTGDDANSTWTINDGGASTYATAARTASIAGFNTLQGGSATDTFNVLDNSATNNYSLKGGAGPDAFNFGSANSLDNITQPVAVDGEAGGANLSLNDQADADPNNYELTANSIGRAGGGTVTFTNLNGATLNAGSGNNKLTITGVPAIAQVAGVIGINFSTGNDTLDIAGVNPATVDLQAPSADPTGFNANLTAGGRTNAFSGAENIIGSAAAGDQLIGLNVASTWTINDTASNTYVADAEPARTLNFSGMDTLQGRAQVDTFNVLNNSTTATYSLKGGAAADAFNFGDANTLAGVTNPISVDGEAASATLTLNDQANAADTNYSAGASTIGRAGGGTVTYSAITDLTLNAGAGKNKLTITATPTATGTKTFHADGNDDTLDVTALTGVSVTLNAANAAGGFDGSATGVMNFTSLNEVLFKGAGSTDTITGLNEDATWTVNDVAGSSYVSQSKTLKFSGADTLNGGSKIDTFNVENNTTTAAYNLNGLAGVDAFNFGNAGSLDGITNGVTVAGGANDATLTLNDAADSDNNNYTLSANQVGRDGGGTVTYSAITDLTVNAGTGANKFTVAAVPSATVSKTLNGNAGADSLDLSALSAVNVNLTGKNANGGFDGSVDGTITLFTSINAANAPGAVGDKLNNNTGKDATWTINEPSSNTFVADGETLSFDQFETLNGGVAKDTYKVQDNTPANPYILNGNKGSDAFLIGDTVNSLADIASLQIDGGVDAADTDELVLLDTAQATNETYSISPTSIGFESSAITPTTATGFNVESIKLNASSGTNTITVFDGNYSDVVAGVNTLPATITLTHVANGKLSALTIDDKADSANNTWNIDPSKTQRTVPAMPLTIDYSATALSGVVLEAGTGSDTITMIDTPSPYTVNGNFGRETINVNKNSHATLVNGEGDNDTFNIANGDLDNIGGALMVDGGANEGITRTVFSGGSTPDKKSFVAASASKQSGDTMNVMDDAQAGLTTYTILNSSVSRTGAAQAVNYKNIDLSMTKAGSGDSDVMIDIPLAAQAQLPFVTVVDGGGGADNRVRIRANDELNNITAGNLTANEADRSQFEVTSVTRMWIEGGKGKNVIHNRSNVPALIDGNAQKTSNVTGGADQNNLISSNATSTAMLSPVLLGNDGLDFLHTTNNGASGTTYLVGDYFINNNVPFIAGSATKTSRLQVVKQGTNNGEMGDTYSTQHGLGAKNFVLARRDTAAGSYNGSFVNVTADALGSNLSVIQWLRGKLGVTITNAGIASRIAEINYHIRQFLRAPGDPAIPPIGHQTYRPGGVGSANNANWSPNGGEDTGESSEAPAEEAVTLTNPYEQGDVNGDGRITAFDALVIINELNSNGAHALDKSVYATRIENGETIHAIDVNGDNSVSALDALYVINKLNLGQTTYQVPELEPVLDSDLLESDVAYEIAAEQVNSGLAESLTDEALLLLIAQYEASRQ